MTDTDLVAGLRDHAAAVEIIAKALPDAASATKEWSGRTASLARQAADRLEALSKPHADARAEEIKKRHEQVNGWYSDDSTATVGRAAHADRAYLLSDRETLIRERDEARAALESASGDTLARFGGKEPFGCHARLDGECNWEHCPQRANYQPHCPRDIRCGDPSCDAVENANAAIRSMKGE